MGGVKVSGSFDGAFEMLVNQRIEDVYLEFDEDIDRMLEEVGLKLNEFIADPNEENTLELFKDSFFKNFHVLFQTIYQQGFLDGLNLGKR